MIEHPVPYDHEAGDHHGGEKSGTEEHPGDQHVILPGDHARTGTVSAQVSTRVRMASSEEEEEIRTWSRAKVTSTPRRWRRDT